jgi:hypothetical protein
MNIYASFITYLLRRSRDIMKLGQALAAYAVLSPRVRSYESIVLQHLILETTILWLADT